MCISLVYVAQLYYNACWENIKVRIFCWFYSSLEHCYVYKHWIAQKSRINVIGYDPVAWNREKCIYSVLCSDPGGLEHADLNVTVLWIAVQIVQSFITWIHEPSQINTVQHFSSLKYAELVAPMEENGNSKQSCTYSTYFFIFLTMKKTSHKLFQQKWQNDTFVGQIVFVTMKAVKLINLLAPELIFLILAHPIYKMWIIQEPNTLELWNKLHFEEKKMESIYHI